MYHATKASFIVRSLLLCTILLLFPLPSKAQELIIILSDNQNTHNDIALSILENTHTNAQVILHNEYTKESSDSNSQIIVSIGTRACAIAIERMNYRDTIICTLIPAQTYQSLLIKNAKTASSDNNLSAIYMDQPIYRQIALARLISPNALNLGTVFGQTSVGQRIEFERIGSEHGFQTHHAFLDDSQNPVQVMTPLIQKSDIFLAIPDNAIFNRSVSRWALYISLRNRIPLIGFSSSYAEAGAVVAIFSTPEQLAQQTSEVVNNYLTRQTLEPASYPKEFTIVTNPSIARTLRMSLPETQHISQQLKEINQ